MRLGRRASDELRGEVDLEVFGQLSELGKVWSSPKPKKLLVGSVD